MIEDVSLDDSIAMVRSVSARGPRQVGGSTEAATTGSRAPSDISDLQWLAAVLAAATSHS